MWSNRIMPLKVLGSPVQPLSAYRQYFQQVKLWVRPGRNLLCAVSYSSRTSYCLLPCWLFYHYWNTLKTAKPQISFPQKRNSKKKLTKQQMLNESTMAKTALGPWSLSVDKIQHKNLCPSNNSQSSEREIHEWIFTFQCGKCYQNKYNS